MTASDPWTAEEDPRETAAARRYEGIAIAAVIAAVVVALLGLGILVVFYSLVTDPTGTADEGLRAGTVLVR